MDKKFYCYSIQLKDFLKLQGINYEYRGRHKKSGNSFWVYNNTPALDEALKNWDTYKSIFWNKGVSNERKI